MMTKKNYLVQYNLPLLFFPFGYVVSLTNDDKREIPKCRLSYLPL
jgi:hypothetical protein